MSTGHCCEECGAANAKLRCTKCKACFYCSRACQTRNWRLHKKICSPDQALRRFVPVEMAIERALAEQPTVQAPKDATCYICLEGDDATGKLMRGCACRGASAGFVHLECLAEGAERKHKPGDVTVARDVTTILTSWMQCRTCNQNTVGALGLKMRRRFWRRYRSGTCQTMFYHSTRYLADWLRNFGESDAATRLYEDTSKYAASDTCILLDMKLTKIQMLADEKKVDEALDLVEATLPQAKAYTIVNPVFYFRAMIQKADALARLTRLQESYAVAAETVTFAKSTFGPDHHDTLLAMKNYALMCACTGRLEEADAVFGDVLSTSSRVCGRDHPRTLECRQMMEYINMPPSAG